MVDTNTTYNRRRALGLCPLCGKKPTEGHAFCQPCLAKRRAANNKRYVEKLAKEGKAPKNFTEKCRPEDYLMLVNKDKHNNCIIQGENKIKTLEASGVKAEDVARLIFKDDIVIVYSVFEGDLKRHVFSGRLPQDLDTFIESFGARECLGLRTYQSTFILYIKGNDIDYMREAIIL